MESESTSAQVDVEELDHSGPYRRSLPAAGTIREQTNNSTTQRRRIIDVSSNFAPSQLPGIVRRAINSAVIWLRGRPLAQPRAYFGSNDEYVRACFVHWFEQRWYLVLGLVLALVGTLLYQLVWRVFYAQSAGVEIVVLDNETFAKLYGGSETRAARAALGTGVAELLTLYRLGANWTRARTSRDLTRREIMDVEEHLQADMPFCSTTLRLRANEFLTKTSRETSPCVCAPALGALTRYIGIGATEVRTATPMVHLFNVYGLDWQAYQNLSAASALPELGALRIVRHSQAHLFDVADDAPRANGARFKGSSDVEIIRPVELRLSARDTTGQFIERLRVSGATAFCVAECLDLFDGLTIWHRAVAQTAANIKVNDNVTALLEFIKHF